MPTMITYVDRQHLQMATVVFLLWKAIAQDI